MKFIETIRQVFSDDEPTGKFDLDELKNREKEAEVAARQELQEMRKVRESYDTRPSRDLNELEEKLDDADRTMREALGD